MEKFEEVLEMILALILSVIDGTFVILEAPYIFIMSTLLSYEKCDIVYIWLPVNGVMSIWINYLTGKVEYSVDGHILIKKLFKK